MKTTCTLSLGFSICLVLLFVQDNVVNADTCSTHGTGFNQPCEKNIECCSTRCNSATMLCQCGKEGQYCDEDNDCCKDEGLSCIAVRNEDRGADDQRCMPKPL